VVALLGRGHFFGEACLAGQLARPASANALAACTVLRIDKTIMLRTLHEQPSFRALFLNHVLSRCLRVEEDLADQLCNASEQRLARALLLLAVAEADGTPEPVIAKISHKVLADMIGTTRSRVSFFMNKFRKLGLIEYERELKIRSFRLGAFLQN
jgi:CRP-like cAMP-binding protein